MLIREEIETEPPKVDVGTESPEDSRQETTGLDRSDPVSETTWHMAEATQILAEPPVRNPNPALEVQIGNDHSATRQSSPPSPSSIYAYPIMSEQRKKERDFTPEVDAALPIATALAQVCLILSCTTTDV